MYFVSRYINIVHFFPLPSTQAVWSARPFQIGKYFRRRRDSRSFASLFNERVGSDGDGGVGHRAGHDTRLGIIPSKSRNITPILWPASLSNSVTAALEQEGSVATRGGRSEKWSYNPRSTHGVALAWKYIVGHRKVKAIRKQWDDNLNLLSLLFGHPLPIC